jgi:hypothetical protein
LKRSPIPAEAFSRKAAQEVEPKRGEYDLANLNLKIASSAPLSAYVIDACSPHLWVRISLWTLPEVTSQTFRGHRIESEGAPTRLFGTSNYNFLTLRLVLHSAGVHSVHIHLPALLVSF